MSLDLCGFYFLHPKRLEKNYDNFGFNFWYWGVLSEIVYINDWWTPDTITGTKIGIEDFLSGFFFAGISFSIGKFFLKQKLARKIKPKYSNWDTILLSAGFLFLFFGTYYLFNFHSFYSSLSAFGFSLTYIYLRRIDLIKPSLIGGLLSMLVVISAYLIILFFSPNFITDFWVLDDHWFSYLIFGIPIGEHVWLLLCGAFIGVFYEFIRGYRII